jgi:hypothetical protein
MTTDGRSSWEVWINRALVGIVGALLAIFVQDVERRVQRIEDEISRIGHLQAAVLVRLERVEKDHDTNNHP